MLEDDRMHLICVQSFIVVNYEAIVTFFMSTQPRPSIGVSLRLTLWSTIVALMQLCAINVNLD